MEVRRSSFHVSCSPPFQRLGSTILCFSLAVMTAACSPEDGSALVADELGDSVAVQVAGALRSAVRTASTFAIERVTANLPDVLPLPDGVERLEVGRWTETYADSEQAQFATAFAVVPVDDSDDPYCVAVTVHSSGRVAARVASGDALDKCADTPLIDLLEL